MSIHTGSSKNEIWGYLKKLYLQHNIHKDEQVQYFTPKSVFIEEINRLHNIKLPMSLLEKKLLNPRMIMEKNEKVRRNTEENNRKLLERLKKK